MLLVNIVVTLDLTIETFQFAFSRCLRESSHEGFANRNGGHLLLTTCGAKSVLRCGERSVFKSRVLDPLLRDLRDLFLVCRFFSREINVAL